MGLARCACGGFVPAQAAACPHCEADVRPSRLRLLCGVVGGSTIAFTLMACYGAAPHRGDSFPPDANPSSVPPDAQTPALDGGR